MKMPKRILILSQPEYRLMLHGLLHFRNKLIEQGRYPDAINELVVKLQRARRCHHENPRPAIRGLHRNSPL